MVGTAQTRGRSPSFAASARRARARRASAPSGMSRSSRRRAGLVGRGAVGLRLVELGALAGVARLRLERRAAGRARAHRPRRRASALSSRAIRSGPVRSRTSGWRARHAPPIRSANAATWLRVGCLTAWPPSRRERSRAGRAGARADARSCRPRGYRSWPPSSAPRRLGGASAAFGPGADVPPAGSAGRSTLLPLRPRTSRCRQTERREACQGARRSDARRGRDAVGAVVRTARRLTARL